VEFFIGFVSFRMTMASLKADFEEVVKALVG
jgi:hypothetical protein